MEFYTAFSEKRPVRLCESTRKFAFDSMHGMYGDDTMKTMHISLDEISGFEEMPFQKQYDTAITEIAKNAPLRICENETVSGAATLGSAIFHIVPAFFGGKNVFYSVSHLTLDFPTVVFRGVDYLEQKIRKSYSSALSQNEREQLEGMLNVVNALHIWHERYLKALESIKPENAEILRNVPFKPARNFREAVQSIWFVFSFTRLCGNWPGIGRIDEMLGGFLEKDLENGTITLQEAREFLAGMFIKGCEWIQSNTPRGSGDAQHYQNIVLGGIDKHGREVTNAVTYLVLDIVEELAISDFPITVRINENTPEKLLTRVAEVMRHGGGIVAVYNEPLIINSLVNFGYSVEESRTFANDGCWEVQIPGKTFFNYVPFDALGILLNDTLKIHTSEPADFASFEDLYSCFKANLRKKIEAIVNERLQTDFSHPCSVVSLFEDGCIDNARSYLAGGARYTVCSPHIGGAPDVGNSLYAIKRLVFKEKKVSFSELLNILKSNWADNEKLRRYVLNKYVYYGNDNDESDSCTVRVINDFADIVHEFDVNGKIRFPAGVSTFGRQIEWSRIRAATPSGKKAGDILSGNASPTPDTDFEGATAVIASYCKADMLKLTCGSALDVKLLPSDVSGENGIESLKSLITGFVKLGGFFMQLDVIDEKILLEARMHPEEHKTLSVRVSGWNARFVTLDDDWQRMIIERSSHGL